MLNHQRRGGLILGRIAALSALFFVLASVSVGGAIVKPANGLVLVQGSGGQPSAEPIRLLVAADQLIRDEREWTRGLSLAVDEAERLLYPYLERPLEVVRTVPWQGSVRSASADPLLRDLVSSVERGDADIVVGIVRAYSFQGFTEAGARIRGLANYRAAGLVLMLGGPIGDHRSPTAEIGSLLAHEVAHVFGAVHRRGTDLLMAPGGAGTRVDALNAALIGMHRQRTFGSSDFPLPTPYREAARPLYRKAIDDDPSDLDSRLMLARLDVETGRYEEAISALEAILVELPGSHAALSDLELARSLWRHEEQGLTCQPGAARWPVRELLYHAYIDGRKARPCS